MSPFHAEGIRTEPPVSVPMAHGARRAATLTPDPELLPPGGPVDGEIPRVPWSSHVLIGPPGAHRELDRPRLADDDDSGRHEPARERRGHRRDARFPDLRAACGDPPFEVDDVLERDRYAVEPPCCLPGAPGEIGLPGRGPRLVRVHGDEGVEPRLEPLDSREQRLHELFRGQLTRRQLFSGGVCGQKFTSVHCLSPSVDVPRRNGRSAWRTSISCPLAARTWRLKKRFTSPIDRSSSGPAVRPIRDL